MRDQGAKLRTTSTRDSGSPGGRAFAKRRREADRFVSRPAHGEHRRPAAGHQRPARAQARRGAGEPAPPAGASANAGFSSRLKSARPTASGSPARTAARSESPRTGVAGTSSRRYTSAVASPTGGHTSTKSSGRPTGSGVTTSPRPWHHAAGGVRKNATSDPMDRRHSREFFPCLRQFPDLIQGQQRHGRIGRAPAQPGLRRDALGEADRRAEFGPPRLAREAAFAAFTTRLSGPVGRPGGSQVREMRPGGLGADFQRVEQVDRHHQRFEVVVAVGALAEDFEEEVEFGRRGDNDAIRPGMEGRVDREGVRVPGRVMVSVGGGSPVGERPVPGCQLNRVSIEPDGRAHAGKGRRRGELSEKAKRRFAVGQYTPVEEIRFLACLTPGKNQGGLLTGLRTRVSLATFTQAEGPDRRSRLGGGTSMKRCLWGLAAVAFIGIAPAQAGDIVYKPIDPDKFLVRPTTATASLAEKTINMVGQLDLGRHQGKRLREDDQQPLQQEDHRAPHPAGAELAPGPDDVPLHLLQELQHPRDAQHSAHPVTCPTQQISQARGLLSAGSLHSHPAPFVARGPLTLDGRTVVPIRSGLPLSCVVRG